MHISVTAIRQLQFCFEKHKATLLFGEPYLVLCHSILYSMSSGLHWSRFQMQVVQPIKQTPESFLDTD